MENKEALDTLHDIKELMEKSTKFMSISGISAILVGIYACIGTGLAYFILNKQDSFDTLFNIPLLNINTTYQLASICLIAAGSTRTLTPHRIHDELPKSQKRM